jgi:hypothetical protein
MVLIITTLARPSTRPQDETYKLKCGHMHSRQAQGITLVFKSSR